MATEADKVNTGALATLVAVSAFSLVGITLAVTALARDQMSVETADKESRAGAQYEKVRSEQLEKLRSGVAIEQAMQKVVADLAQDPRSATPDPAPTAGASPGGVPATPAPPASAPTAPEGTTGALAPAPGPGEQGKKRAAAPPKGAAPAAPPGAGAPRTPPAH